MYNYCVFKIKIEVRWKKIFLWDFLQHPWHSHLFMGLSTTTLTFPSFYGTFYNNPDIPIFLWDFPQLLWHSHLFIGLSTTTLTFPSLYGTFHNKSDIPISLLDFLLQELWHSHLFMVLYVYNNSDIPIFLWDFLQQTWYSYLFVGLSTTTLTFPSLYRTFYNNPDISVSLWVFLQQTDIPVSLLDFLQELFMGLYVYNNPNIPISLRDFLQQPWHFHLFMGNPAKLFARFFVKVFLWANCSKCPNMKTYICNLGIYKSSCFTAAMVLSISCSVNMLLLHYLQLERLSFYYLQHESAIILLPAA